jgi:hypothetical protein
MLIGTTTRTPAGTAEVVVLQGGTPQPLYRHPAGGRIFTPGTEFAIYTLRVRNLTSGRIEVITTVDGRNTLKDEPGDSFQNRGLIIPGHGTAEFTGWRISDDVTREFVFGSPQSSVAARATGSAAGTGVIGFAVYREYIQPAPTWDIYSTSAPVGSAGPVTRGVAMAAASAAPQSSLGTGIGEARADHVGRTQFHRATGAEPDLLAIGYETEDILRMRGLLGPAEPDAFPGIGTGYEKYAPR